MKVLVIVNTRSGLGDAGVYDYVRDLGALGVEITIRFLNTDSQLMTVLRDADAFERVVAVGGDGTAASIAYTLRHTAVPLVVFPTGTANLLARNLRIPADPLELAEMTVHGRTISLDLGELDVESSGEHSGIRVGFMVMGGAGFAAALIQSAESLKGVIGESAYVVGALQHFLPRMAKITLELDDRTVLTEGIAVLFINLSRVQFDLAITHDSSAQDGVMEVVVINTPNVAGLLPTAWAAILDRIGNHPDRPSLEIHTASSVRVTSEPPFALQYDGEVLSAETPVNVRILPLAAAFVVPRDPR